MRIVFKIVRALFHSVRNVGNNRLLASSSYFDESWYLTQYADRLGRQSCISHYLRKGAKIGLDPSPYFSTNAYLEDNPDVAKAGINPLVHFLRYGQFEGRMPKSTHSALGLDEMLWSGVDEKMVCRELHDLVDGKAISNSERVFAAWALVRWYAAQGEWRSAEALLPILREADSRYVFLGNLTLVEIDGMLHSGLLSAAEKRLEEELRNSPSNFDLYLARANLFQCQGDRQNKRLQCLNDIYRVNDLSLLELKCSEKSVTIDNLRGDLPDKRAFENEEYPLVSVLVPAFNSAETLITALESLAKQSWHALEVIIIDDASTDNTVEVAEAFAAQDARFQISRRSYCEGPYAARNLGLSQAKGEFVTVHDADDWSHPEKIERQVRHLLAHPKLMACASHWVRCTDCLEFGAWRIENGWIEQNISSWMFRRKVFQDLGYWDRVKVGADSEFYWRLIQAYGEKALSDVLPGVPLSFGRMTSNSLTGSSDTHIRTSISGVRKSYIDAARRWHDNTRNLYLPEHQESRRFLIPPQLRVDVKEYKGEKNLVPGRTTILMVAHSASTRVFGAQLCLLDFLAALSDLGVNVILTIPELENQKYFEQLSTHVSKIFLLPYRWWNQDRNIARNVQANFQHIINRSSVDIVYCNTALLWEPLVAARTLGVKTVIHVHELLKHDQDLCKELNTDPDTIRRHILELADRLVVPSKAVASWLGAEDRTSVLPNVVDEALLSLPSRPKGDFSVGLISCNIPKKGLSDFVELARNLASYDVSCILIGPDNSFVDELRQKQVKGEVPSNLRFAGLAKNPAEAIAQVDVVVNLSHFQESFGRTVIEAMAAGRVVVCYEWGALPELVVDGETGYLIPLGDVESVARHIIDLLNNPDLRRELGSAGRQRIQDHFVKDKLISGLNNLISSALDR